MTWHENWIDSMKYFSAILNRDIKIQIGITQRKMTYTLLMYNSNKLNCIRIMMVFSLLEEC